MRATWVTLGRWIVGQRDRRRGIALVARGRAPVARARSRRRAGRWARAARRAETARARRGRRTRSPERPSATSPRQRGTGVEDRGERMPCVADRVSPVENGQELVRRPQAVVITHAPAYLPEAHGAQGAASMLHTYAAAAPGTRTRSRCDQHLGDLDAVGRRALAQVVGDDPQRQTVRARLVAPDAADQHLDPGRRA